MRVVILSISLALKSEVGQEHYPRTQNRSDILVIKVPEVHIYQPIQEGG